MDLFLMLRGKHSCFATNMMYLIVIAFVVVKVFFIKLIKFSL